MSEETRELTEDIVDLGKLIVVAIIMIAMVFLVIKTFVGEVPAYVLSGFIALGGIFLYATNKKIREHFNDWLNKKKHNNPQSGSS